MPDIDLKHYLGGGGPGRGGAGGHPSGRTVRLSGAEIALAVKRLPALPAILHEVIRDLSNVNADLARLQERISSDPSLTTRLLKMANSSFYNSSTEICSIARALTTLGFRTACNVVVASALRAALYQGDVPGFSRRGLFRHSLGSAVCSARLGRMVPTLRSHQDQLFVAGLLHDVGMVALSTVYAQNHIETGSDCWSRDQILDVERQLLGTDHLEIGLRVWEHWGLPRELLAPITRHHEPLVRLLDEPLTLAVAVTELYLDQLGFGRPRPVATPEDVQVAIKLLGAEPALVLPALEGFEQEVAAIHGALTT
jgi:HD-like signal output (HDOD) protein